VSYDEFRDAWINVSLVCVAPPGVVLPRACAALQRPGGTEEAQDKDATPVPKKHPEGASATRFVAGGGGGTTAMVLAEPLLC